MLLTNSRKACSSITRQLLGPEQTDELRKKGGIRKICMQIKVSGGLFYKVSLLPPKLKFGKKNQAPRLSH